MLKTFKYKLEIEITIDENNIHKKYPNYIWNYYSTESFADSLISEENYEIDTSTTKERLKQWGYSIKKKRIRTK